MQNQSHLHVGSVEEHQEVNLEVQLNFEKGGKREREREKERLGGWLSNSCINMYKNMCVLYHFIFNFYM